MPVSRDVDELLTWMPAESHAEITTANAAAAKLNVQFFRMCTILAVTSKQTKQSPFESCHVPLPGGAQ